MPYDFSRRRAFAELLGGACLLGLALWLSLPRPVRPKPSDTPLPSAEARASRDAPSVLGASYTLKARLDSQQHRVDGEGTIHWVNHSRAEVRSLFVHLYLNAFKNDRSLFLRSPFGAGRSGARAREFGYVDVAWLKVREFGDADLWPGRAKHSPFDPDDETDIEVPLPEAVAPGTRLTIDVAFKSQLPEIVERTGYSGDFHFVAQWFPKLARLESDGTFAHFAFHPQSEFYADYGRYDVTLDVPASFVVGASGKVQESRVEQGRKHLRYVAEPVHDFAWTAWDGFRESKRRIGNVEVTLLSPRTQSSIEEPTFDALGVALPYFAQKFGPYPYDTLTVVHPPEFAEAAGGMEYPTLITTGGPWYLPYSGARALEAVTVHELAHQWFYGIFASNEAKWPFLDEGLTSFAELSLMRNAFGDASALNAFGLRIDDASLFRVFSAARAEDEPVASEAAEFSSFRNLASLVYSRTAIVLETVARVWGRARLERALGAYAERFRFDSPTPDGLLQVIREHVGEDAGLMVERALLQRGSVDYVVREVESGEQLRPTGFFERASGRERVKPVPGERGERRARATIYRHGSLEIPVDVVLVAEDGSRQTFHWDGRGRPKTFEHRGTSPLSHVLVDPERNILLDQNLFNNQAALGKGGVWRVRERLGYFAQLTLGGLAP